MAQKDFKPLYRAKFSSGGALQNDIFPKHIDYMLDCVQLMLFKEKSAIKGMYASLQKLTPPFSKFFKDYNSIMKELSTARDLLNSWQRSKYTMWPIALEDKLMNIYDKWWLAFNESGLGFEYELQRDVERDRWKAITGGK